MSAIGAFSSTINRRVSCVEGARHVAVVGAQGASAHRAALERTSINRRPNDMHPDNGGRVMRLPSVRACRTMQRDISVFMRLPKRYTRRQYTRVQHERASNCGKLGRALRKLRFRCRVREMLNGAGQ